MSKLLINERPMMLLPSLAEKIGSDEAIVLQQIQYWITTHEEIGNERTFREGRWWVYNTVEAWQEKQFKWWACSKVKKILIALEKMGLIISKKFESSDWNQRKWYSIEYGAIQILENLDIQNWKMSQANLIKTVSNFVKNASNPHGYALEQNATIDRSDLSQSNGVICDDHLYTKTTNKDYSSEITKSKKATSGCRPACDQFEKSDSPREDQSRQSGQTKSEPSEQSKQTSRCVAKKMNNSVTTQRVPLEDVYSAPPKIFEKVGNRIYEFAPKGMVMLPKDPSSQIARGLTCRAMQIWLYEQLDSEGFQIALAPDSTVWGYDPQSGDWEAEVDLLPVGKLVHLACHYFGVLAIEEFNDMAITVFESIQDWLKRTNLSVEQIYSKSIAIWFGWEYEQLDWDDLGLEEDEED